MDGYEAQGAARNRLLCPLRKDFTRHKKNLSCYHGILIYNYDHRSPTNTNVSINIMS